MQLPLKSHIQGNSVSCIDLIFSSQPNSVMSSGIHYSLHQICHHQTIFARLNLKVHYPPPYEPEQRHILWLSKSEYKSYQKGYLFNKTIKNLLSNFMPHETITFDDRDPPWINSQVKHLIHKKNVIYKNHFKNNKSNQSFAINQSNETFQSLES